MPDTEQSWEVACQDLVQSLGVHSPTNMLMEATLLADALAQCGQRVQLYSQRVQHRFGTWTGEAGNRRWQTARKEEQTLVGVRLGDRLVFRRLSYGVAERVAKQIGIKLTQRSVGKGLSRWLPVVGALGVGAYAYYDTGQVANTAIELFEGELSTENEVGDSTANDEGMAPATHELVAPKPRVAQAE